MADIVLAGNTSGTLTLSAPDVAGTTTLNLPASSGTVLDDASVGVCRAWVNFNGTGTVAIRAGFNVSSITDNGAGDYTVNFATAMPAVNYAATIGNVGNNASSIRVANIKSGGLYSTTQLQIFVTDQIAGVADTATVNVAVFR